jgi:hypothetical protein
MTHLAGVQLLFFLIRGTPSATMFVPEKTPLTGSARSVITETFVLSKYSSFILLFQNAAWFACVCMCLCCLVVIGFV